MFNYNGQSWEYQPGTTLFILETGRYDNAYRTKKTFTPADYPGDKLPKEAIEYYERFQVSDGYKKRLSMITEAKKQSLAHFISFRKEGHS